MRHLYAFGQEYPRVFLEFLLVLGSKVPYRSAFRAAVVHVGMAVEIVFQAFGHIFSLRYNADAFRNVLFDFRYQDGVVCASEYNRVDTWVETKNVVNAFLDEVIGTGPVGLVVLNNRYPQWAGNPVTSISGHSLLISML